MWLDGYSKDGALYVKHEQSIALQVHVCEKKRCVITVTSSKLCRKHRADLTKKATANGIGRKRKEACTTLIETPKQAEHNEKHLKQRLSVTENRRKKMVLQQGGH